MTLNSIPCYKLATLLASGEFVLRLGPFFVQLKADIDDLAELIQRLYGDCQLEAPNGLSDFHLHLSKPRNLRRFYRPQARFMIDGQSPFAPFPVDHAFPLFEWGLNWCVASYSHQFLMLHSAVVEKNGKAVLLPAWPGSGKSTLCAALVFRGWRLLSDEFGLIRPGTNAMIPFPRCIPLKNESIAILRDFAPESVSGPIFPRTRKGDVAHLKPPTESVQRSTELAVPAFVIFPRYTPGQHATLRPLAKARAFMKLAGNAFNYELLGESGFRTVASLIHACDTFLFHYDDLKKAVQTLDRLVE
jgi:HprK-related kinase A